MERQRAGRRLNPQTSSSSTIAFPHFGSFAKGNGFGEAVVLPGQHRDQKGIRYFWILNLALRLSFTGTAERIAALALEWVISFCK